MPYRPTLQGVAAKLMPERYGRRYLRRASEYLRPAPVPGQAGGGASKVAPLCLHFRDFSSSGHEQPSPTSKPLDVWDLLFRARRLAIVGESGSGKTTLLRSVFTALAQDEIGSGYVSRLTFLHHGEASDHLLPVYVDIDADLREGDLTRCLSTILARHGFPGAGDLLKATLQKGTCFLLLDRSAEQDDREPWLRAVELLAPYPKTLVIACTRFPAALDALPGFARFEILPLTQAEIQAIVQERLGKDSSEADWLMQALERDSALASLATNRLLLATLIDAASEIAGHPMGLTELFQCCLHCLLRAGGTAESMKVHSIGTTVQLLELFASYLHERRQTQFSDEELHTAFGQVAGGSDLAARAAPRRLAHHSALFRSIGTTDMAFVRLGLQQSLAARVLANSPQFLQYAIDRAADDWWQETIVLAAVLSGQTSRLAQRIVDLDAHWDSVILAARCAAEDPALRPGLSGRISAKLYDVLDSGQQAYWTEAALRIASLQGQRTCSYFANLLRTGTTSERERAAFVMGRVGSAEWASVALLGALDVASPVGVRLRAIWSLGQLRDKRAVPLLLDQLKDADAAVATQAALALAAMGEAAVPGLISLLGSAQPAVCQSAVKALSSMANVALRPLLNIVQDDTQPEVAVAGAAQALGLLRDVQAIPSLVQLLRARDGKMAPVAAAALASLGAPAARALVDALPTQGAESELGATIVGALVSLGADAIPSLIQSLDNPNSTIRNAAAEALTRLGSTATSALIESLRTDRWDLRRRIAQVLARIGDVTLAEPLLRMIHDDDPGVRVHVAQILGHIGDEQTVRPLVDMMQNDCDESVRRAALTGLGELQSPEAVAPLIGIMRDPALRETAMHALKEIGQDAIEPLIEALGQSGDAEIQQACAETLTLLGARGRLGEHNLFAVARVYAELCREQPDLSSTLDLLAQIAWWVPAAELQGAFSVAGELLQVKQLPDVSGYLERLSNLGMEKEFHRKPIQRVLVGLANIAHDIRLYLQDSRRENQRDAMLSTINSMADIQRTIDTQLLPFERKVFADVIAHWRALTEEALKDLRGRAQLTFAPISASLPMEEPTTRTTVVFRVVNEGDGAARNLSATLKPGTHNGFDVIGQPTQQLYGLGPGMQADLEYWIVPHAGSECSYLFEITYDDDEAPAQYKSTSGQLRFFAVGKAYRPIPVSPYVMGPPVKSTQMFYGRGDVFSWIQENLSGSEQQNILILHGERRMGKTSILYQLLNTPLSPQYLCILFSLELAVSTTLGDLLYDLATTMEVELSKLGFAAHNLEEAEFLHSPQRAFLRFCESLTRELGDRRLLIMIDELDRLIARVEEGQLNDDVFHFLRGLMQHSDKFAFILTGAVKVREMLKDDHSILFNIARSYNIGYLKETEAQALIIEPLSGYLTFDGLVVNRILRVTACHPYFVQYICDSLVKLAQRARKNIVYLPDIDQILQEIVQDNNGVLQKSVYSPLTGSERRVLAALASVTNDRTIYVPPETIAQALERHRLTLDRPTLMGALRMLQERELVDERRVGQILQYSFRMDLIRLWIGQNEMLLRLSQEASG